MLALNSRRLEHNIYLQIYMIQSRDTKTIGTHDRAHINVDELGASLFNTDELGAERCMFVVKSVSIIFVKHFGHVLPTCVCAPGLKGLAICCRHVHRRTTYTSTRTGGVC